MITLAIRKVGSTLDLTTGLEESVVIGALPSGKLVTLTASTETVAEILAEVAAPPAAQPAAQPTPRQAPGKVESLGFYEFDDDPTAAELADAAGTGGRGDYAQRPPPQPPPLAQRVSRSLPEDEKGYPIVNGNPQHPEGILVDDEGNVVGSTASSGSSEDDPYAASAL